MLNFVFVFFLIGIAHLNAVDSLLGGKKKKSTVTLLLASFGIYYIPSLGRPGSYLALPLHHSLTGMIDFFGKVILYGFLVLIESLMNWASYIIYIVWLISGFNFFVFVLVVFESYNFKLPLENTS